MPITDFPEEGGDKAVSLDNSQYPVFPVKEALELRDNYPEIWDEGGNIRGNSQFAILSPMAEEKRGPDSNEEEEAIRLREAWIARHFDDFQLPGVVAQIKWLAIGSRGLEHMRQVISEAKQAAEPTEQARNITSELVSNQTGSLKAYQFMISTDGVDRQNEIVDAAGWDFSNWLKNPVILDSHKLDSIDDIIGKGIGLPVRVNNGWAIDIEFADTARGQLARKLVDAGMLRSVSVGFRSLKRVPEKGIVRHVKQELLEVSLVAVPANPEAVRIKGKLGANMIKRHSAEELPMLLQARDFMQMAVAKLDEIIAYCIEYDAEGEDMPAAEVSAEAPMSPAPESPSPEDSGYTYQRALKQLVAAFKSIGL
jgi:HK97 family phage prohead protease